MAKEEGQRGQVEGHEAEEISMRQMRKGPGAYPGSLNFMLQVMTRH